MKKQLLLFMLAATCQVNMLQAQSSNNYPGRYMGREDVKTITAPNGAVADAGFAQTLQLIYPQPTIEKAGEGIWVLGGIPLPMW
jgi:hypothetical protein